MTKRKSKKTMENLAPTRTAQHCAQCTAHGKISLLKGHKKQCPFKECRCVHCALVNNKRQIMAKQVKLKRLQEKNHSRQRRGLKPSIRETMAESLAQGKSPDYLDEPGLNEMQHYQEEAWQAVCGQNDEMQHFHQTQISPKCTPSDHRVSAMLPFTHSSPLQQLQTATYSSFFPPCCPVSSSAPPLNLFTTPIGEPEGLQVNHVLTQPIFYQFPPPSFGQNSLLSNPFPAFPDEGFLPPVEMQPAVNGNGNLQSIDAAEALLTLRTGEE